MYCDLNLTAPHLDRFDEEMPPILCCWLHEILLCPSLNQSPSLSAIILLRVQFPAAGAHSFEVFRELHIRNLGQTLAPVNTSNHVQYLRSESFIFVEFDRTSLAAKQCLI